MRNPREIPSGVADMTPRPGRRFMARLSVIVLVAVSCVLTSTAAGGHGSRGHDPRHEPGHDPRHGMRHPDPASPRLDYGDYPHFEVGFSESQVYGFASRGMLIYAAAARGLEIWDLAEPRVPRLLGTLLPGQPMVRVRIAGDLLYALTRDGHLLIMDLTASAVAPTVLCDHLVDSGNWSLLSLTDMVVEGTHAYVVSAYRGVYVLDVAVPRSPRLVVRLNRGGTSLGPAAVEGNLLCLVTYGDVVVYDISDAEHPFETLYIPTDAWTGSVLLHDGLLYLGEGYRGLSIYDLRDLRQHRELARLERSGYDAGPMILDGNLLLSGNYSGGLALIDVADPATPRLNCVFGGGQDTYALTQVGNHVVIGTLDAMQVLDLANREAVRPHWATSIHPDGYHLVSAGNQVFIAAYQYIDRLQLVRGGPPIALEAIYGQYRDFNDLALAPGLLVATAAHAGLFVYAIDESGPARLVGTWQRAERPLYGIAMSGTLAVVNCGGWLGFVDLSQPESPQLLSELSLGVQCLGVDLQGTFGYAAAERDGLVGFDFSDPRQPRIVSRIADDVQVTGVSWRGHRLLVGTVDGLRVYDAHHAEPPVLRSEVALPAYVLDPVIDGSTAYLPTRDQGMQVVSLQDPDHPELLGGYDPLKHFVGAHMAGEHLMLAARDTLYELPRQAPGRRPPHHGAGGSEDVRPSGLPETAIAMKSANGTHAEPREIGARTFNLVASPNPARFGTTVALEMAADGQVEIAVFDVAGRCVRHLTSGTHVSGRGEWRWDGRDDGARELPSGTYFLRAATGRDQITTRVLLVR